MNLNIKPLMDRVIIEPIIEEKTPSGIIIPSTAQEKSQKGIVISIGNGKKDEPITVKVNDLVFYEKYSGSELTIDDKNYIILHEKNIMAILN